MASFIRTATLLAIAALCVAPAGLAGTRQAQDFYIHGLSLDGRVSVDGTMIEKYRGRFLPTADIRTNAVLTVVPAGPYADPFIDVVVENPRDIWSAIAEISGDRFALRRDGRINRNDELLFNLPSTDSPWLDLIVPFGLTYALRADGTVARDGVVIAAHPAGAHHFRRIVSDGLDVYCLRSDGTVFRSGDEQPYFAFRAGADGATVRTTWVAAALDATRQYIYALRADGVVARGLLLDGPLFGERVTELPFVPSADVDFGQIYFDLEFSPDGTWYALAGDGRVFTSDDTSLPFVDLPGNANAPARTYTDIDVLFDAWFALRTDGRVYRDGNPDPLCQLPAARHGSMVVSRFSPLLNGPRTKRPTATVIRAKVVEGGTLRLPIVVRDLDTCAADLVFTPDQLPPGATFDAALGTLVWTTAGPAGNHRFLFRVSDGTNVRNVAYRIRVKERDLDAGKNTRPLIASFGNALAVVGEEFALPVLVADKDGDPLTVTVKLATYPFTAGATFDTASRTPRWTPTDEDCGAVVVKFTVTDGDKQRSTSVRIRVRKGLFF